MGKISYDPIKNRFAGFVRHSRLLRRLFYGLLDLFFLRSWHIRKIIKRKAESLEKKGEWSLLDAGCGFGQYGRFILNRYRNVRITSIDVKQDYLEDCKRYFSDEIRSGRIRFELEDLLELQRKEPFDLILCIDVLEHIADDQAVLENLADLLKPGGRILIHSPSHLSAEDAGDDESFVGEHARAGYSKQDLEEKIRKAGLHAEQIHYTYGPAGHFSWEISVKYPMIWLNKTGMAGMLLLLFYYPLVLPASLLMNAADLYTKNERGNGIYAVALRK